MPATLLERDRRKRTRPAQMRTATIASPERVEIEDRPRPSPGPNQVRVRLEGCGVCASNLPVWEGRPWFTYPLESGAPGHEGWGMVDALGEGVTALEEGDRVALLSYHAFAEYDLADASAVARLPESLDYLPMPGEPLGCALNIFSRADIRPGQRVAVLGCGFLGALLIQLVEQSGAEVVAISRRPWSLELARRCGAHHAYPLTDPQGTLGLLEEALGGSLCERVIEATGKQIGLDIATQLVAERGKLIIAGYHQDGARSVNMQLWNWRGIDVINAHERDQQVYMSGIRAAIKAVEQGRLEITSLLTHRFELDDLGQALQLAGERPEGFLKSYIAVA